MGYLRRPSYFKDFHCISSKCTDSCCWHWEIDIDDDTLQYYNQVPGEFGRRLREHIMPPNPDTDEPAHFIPDEKERCPFLNSCNLCDIFIHLGEEHLSYICTHHPRYYDWLIGGQEAGLGLCCEEAARLILQKTGYPSFEVIEYPDCDPSYNNGGLSPDDGNLSENSPAPDEDLLLEQTFENRLLAMREELFAIIKPCCSHPGTPAAAPSCCSISVPASVPSDCSVPAPAAALDALMDSLYQASLSMQEECDRIFFPEELPAEVSADTLTGLPVDTAPTSPDSASWSAAFWQEDRLTELLDRYLTLEINDPAWWRQLHQMKGTLSELLSRREAFLSFYRDRLYEYEQLLIYFIYRHFMKAREDLMLVEKVSFALISVCMIQLLDIRRWLSSGALSLKDQIDICKLYSKEIEYDEENTEQVSLF